MNLYESYIHLSRYARFRDDLGRRETWPETVERLVEFWAEEYPEFAEVWRGVLQNAILNLEVMPSMRTLMTAGEALRRDNVAGYNCSALAIDNPKAWDEAMYVLMCGTGVGFSVERQYVSRLPVVAEDFHESDTVIVVPDSKIGWAKSFRELVAMLYAGMIPSWDMSKVRPAGSRLKTFGGRASGPEPLDELFRFTVDLFRNASGRKLNSLECHDLMCKVAEIVVVGGVRRSALLSLSNLSDDRMRHAKSGAWWETAPHRAMANNSVAYTENPDSTAFLREWLALVESGSGERGIFNRVACNKIIPERRKELGYTDWLTNPCQPGFATVLTPEGIRTFDDISVGSVVWSGSRWTKVVNKWSTGIKPVYRYYTTTGSFVGTENHRIIQNGERVEVGQAESIDWCVGPQESTSVVIDCQDIMDGLVIGDGSVHKASNNLVYLNIGENDQDYFSHAVSSYIGKKRPGLSKYAYEVTTTISPDELPRTYEREVPSRFFFGDSGKKIGFLVGLFSANGSVCDGRVTLKQSSKKLIYQVQEMLSSLGIPSYITTNKPSEVTFANGTYKCRESYDLNITTGRNRFMKMIGFIQQYKNEKVVAPCKKPRTTTSRIKDVEYLGDYEVYDITVEDEEHTYWTGGCLVSNCSEIILRNNQFCNLTEVVARPRDTWKTLAEKVKVATIIGTFQATLTRFRYLSRKWQKNTEEERLLGVSITGIMDCSILHRNANGDLGPNLSRLRDVAIQTNKEWSEKLGISPATAITCVKPSGTVSQLVDAASGIHPRYAPYYIRSVRADNKDPLAIMMRDLGFPCEPDVTKPDSGLVFFFPMRSPKGSVYRNDMSAIEQLELWSVYQTYWCEHKPSITVYVRPDEWPRVGAWVYDHFDLMSGVSFLPYSEHTYRQAPYEEVDDEKYKEMVSRMPTIKKPLAELLGEYEKEDNTTSTHELSCTAGACEL